MADYVIRFKTACKPYNANETAGFSASQARRLVVQGVAEYVDPPKGYNADGSRKTNGKEPEGLRHNGGGWFELLDFKDENGDPIRVKGREAAVAAREDLIAQALENQVPAGEDDGDGDAAENPDDDDGSE